MAIFKKANSVLKRFRRDESGMAALSWAISLTAIIGAMGAAMDFAVLSSADARSQSIADTTALAAAIYVKTNGRPPTGTGELVEGEHKASDLGYDYKGFVVDGADGVKVHIKYDDNAKEVTTTVSGKTNPILVQVLGFSDLNFNAQSVVSYLNIEDKFPASIALVLDNSGSMAFDDRLPVSVENVDYTKPCWRWNFRRGYFRSTCTETHEHGVRADGATVRLDGLKASVIKFQDDLRARLGTENDSSRRTIRMGMLPYSSMIIANGERPMNWGYIPEGNPSHPTNFSINGSGIRGMRATGGTNSSPPMARARTWLQAEDAIHAQEAERVGTPNDKDPLKFVIFMTDGQNTSGNWQFTPGPTGRYHFRRFDGSYASRDTPAPGFVEGTATLLTDQETTQACQAMHNDGITIFTIGYALEEFGDYRVNKWGGSDDDDLHDDDLFNVSESVQSAAYNLMENCASTPDHFIRAGDADQLEAAFDEIQNAIVEELIRLKA